MTLNYTNTDEIRSSPKFRSRRSRSGWSFADWFWSFRQVDL